MTPGLDLRGGALERAAPLGAGNGWTVANRVGGIGADFDGAARGFGAGAAGLDRCERRGATFERALGGASAAVTWPRTFAHAAAADSDRCLRPQSPGHE